MTPAVTCKSNRLIANRLVHPFTQKKRHKTTLTTTTITQIIHITKITTTTHTTPTHYTTISTTTTTTTIQTTLLRHTHSPLNRPSLSPLPSPGKKTPPRWAMSMQLLVPRFRMSTILKFCVVHIRLFSMVRFQPTTSLACVSHLATWFVSSLVIPSLVRSGLVASPSSPTLRRETTPTYLTTPL